MRRIGTFLAAALTAAALVALAPAPATGATVLCSGVANKDVAKCDSGWAANMHFMHWRMYAGHNCTNYVAYRLKRDGVPMPPYRLGNADTWAPNAKRNGVRVDNQPAVGSVGAWPGRRHVVYVDEVGPGYLIISEDNWPGYYPKGMYRKLKVLKGDRMYPTQFIHFKGGKTISGPLPTVDGAAEVGSTLTADAGTWTPSGVTFAYQWLRDGVIVSGATDPSHTLTAADAGHRMSISVTGSKSGYVSRTASSAPTDEVTAGDPTPATPVVTGTPKVGSTLTADPGSWGPGVTFTYQWLSDGSTIGGATSKTYVPTDAVVGKRISVKVTGRATGADTMSAESARTAAVARKGETPSAVVQSSVPTVTGPAKRGRTLTGDPGTWGPSGVALTYEWLRSDGVVVGTGLTTYKVRSVDLGKQLTFRVTGSKKSLATVTESSQPTETVRATSTLDVTPEVTGRAVALGVVVSVSNAPTPTGIATVHEGAKKLKSNDLALGRPGRATLRLTLSKGTHTLTVSYSGSELHLPATTTVTVTVR